MATTNTLNTKIITCNDSTLNWGTSTKVLLKGEIAIECRTGSDTAPKFKVGDGESTWAELPYATLTPTEIAGLISAASHSHTNLDLLESITAAYTTAEASKLANIEAQAEVNIIEAVKVNNTALTVDSSDRSVNVVVPTNVSDLTNDAGYISSYTNTTYTLGMTKGSSNGNAKISLTGMNGSTQASKDEYTITGAGSVTVTTDGTTGNITITGVDTVYTHPTSGVTAGTYKSVTVDANGHVTAGTNPTTLAGYGITDAAASSHTHQSDDIVSLDASKLTGMVDIARLPSGALERLVIVADDTARLALTADDVQLGDTVKVEDTGIMYFVKDLPADEEDPLDATCFEVYTAGAASTVAWSGVTDKPVSYTPSAHTHQMSDVTGLDTALAGKATSAQGALADTAVQSVKIGTDNTEYKTGTSVVLPAYPTTLPASDVYDWAKAATAPTYDKNDVGLGNLTNDRQIKGKASDTVENHVVTWGPDGYTVKDSGFTIATSVPANAVFTDTTYSVFTGATDSAAGAAGLVKQPVIGDEVKFLKGDGTWAVPTDTNNAVTMTLVDHATSNDVIYLSGSTSNTTNTGGQEFTTAVYIDADGKLNSTNGFVGTMSGNAASATTAGKLTNAQNFSITGGATAAAVSFDGTSAVALNVTSLDATKLAVASGDTLILNGGSAT